MKCTQVVLAFTLALSSYTAVAENTFEDTIKVNAFIESIGYGTSAQYRFSKDWSARVEYAVQNTNDANRYGADALYHIGNSPVYGIVGLKQIDTSESITTANIGVGIAHKVSKRWGVLLESVWYEGLNEDYTEMGLKLGVSYSFGGSSDSARTNSSKNDPARNNLATTATTAAAVSHKDADKDNIIDSVDICPNTPIEDAVDSKGCSRYEDHEVSVNLLVNFSHNTSAIDAKYFDNIASLAHYLIDNPDTTLKIEGHASPAGEEDYNLALSKRRAESVANILVKRYDINKSRIKTIGHGESKFKKDRPHAESRRVEVFNTTNISVKVKRKESDTVGN